MEAIIHAVHNRTLSAHIAVIISNQPNAKGLAIAAQHGIPAYCINRDHYASKHEHETALLTRLKGYHVSLVCLAGYMAILGPCLLQGYPDAILNIHPSLLPSFKGLHPQKQALAAGVKYTGCTVHFVVQDIDAGPIVDQAIVAISPTDTEETLSQKILDKEHCLYPTAIAAVLNKKKGAPHETCLD